MFAAAILAAALFLFRPGGVTGPRAEPVPPPAVGFDHVAFTEVLASVVGDDGLVDYAKLAAERGQLDRYLGLIAETSPGSAPHRFKSEDDRLAYYLNAFNAFVLAAIRDDCRPVQEQYFGGGFFWRVSFQMGGEPVTLSDLESRYVREVRGSDAVAHLALVKGAKGFPVLRREAYEGATVREEMGALARRLATDPKMIRLDGSTLHASELFQMYQADFRGGVDEWLKTVAPELVEGKPTVKYEPLDWSLNASSCPAG